MSNIKTIAEFPAYKVLDGTEKSYLQPGDKLYINGRAGYQISDVASYALQYGECPMAAVEKAKARCHEVYYIISLGTSITSHKRPQESLYGFRSGDIIRYAGKRFEIVKQLNNNFGLKEVA